MAFFTQTRPVADGVFGNVRSWALGDLFAVFTRWNDQRITRMQLNALSDRELSDIGLCRADIEDAVTEQR
ncbi:DUF1127 domain-containing protein [Roseicitreum antarcticum]|uniref:YjiS-like domain-containing protein n=1 Tax=Roseicitreum antarcticum TaxID=564137 RepID=A0A1H2RCH9_9RHOB|nr:DUF1127 domain-containing protein [Roseicitreum antarcticum]SDW17071.1 protein of unknown function [Roseicitreum antarcticum]